jgi:broad specificity phosphatase PhoE
VASPSARRIPSGTGKIWLRREDPEKFKSAHVQARIVRAVEQIMSQALGNADIAIVGHGGTGTLLYCHFAGVPICRRFDQPPTNSGNWFGFNGASRKLSALGLAPD